MKDEATGVSSARVPSASRPSEGRRSDASAGQGYRLGTTPEVTVGPQRSGGRAIGSDGARTRCLEGGLMPEPQTLQTGLAFGESPRWHDGCLWLSDWGTQGSLPSRSTAAARSSSAIPTARPEARLDRGGPGQGPFSIDWLPDGRLVPVGAENHVTWPDLASHRWAGSC